MDSANKMISVVIVTRDRLELLNRAIKSILTQQYAPVEIIIVDNQSATPLVLEASNSANVSIKVYRTHEFLSASATRNYGIELSNGDYICFLDDDDYYLQGKFSVLLEAINRSEHVSMAYGNTKMIGANNSDLGLCSGPAEIISLMLYRYIHLNAVLIKRSVLIDQNFDLNMTTYEDVDLMFRIVKNYQCIQVDQNVAVWNRDNRKDQLTNRNWTRAEKNWLILCTKHGDFIDTNSDLAEFYYKKMMVLSAIKFKLINTCLFFIKYIRFAKLAKINKQ